MGQTEAAEGKGEDGRGRHLLQPGRGVALLAALLLATALAVALPRFTGRTGADRLVLAASELEYSARVLEARPGEVEVTFANTDAVPHTFTVPALGVDLEVAPGEARTATFSARAGSYSYLCTIPGHTGPGMRGELKVH